VPYYIVICGLSGRTVFFPNYLTEGTIFWGKKRGVTEHKMCVLIFCTTFVRNISHSKENSTRYYRIFWNLIHTLFTVSEG
jgi:hypothetical protein